MTEEAFSLWDDQGSRLYLTADERTAFRAAARAHDDRSARTFCQLLLFTGCRISEGLEITPERFDWQDQAVMFRTLKKRGRKALTSYRAVPLPAEFLDELDLIHHLKGRGRSDPKARLWTWSRPTAWRRVKGVMEAAGIEGTHASPKGLRHGFGVVHALNKTPLPTLQRWMGHSDPKTTAIYMQVVGEEARQLAGRGRGVALPKLQYPSEPFRAGILGRYGYQKSKGGHHWHPCYQSVKLTLSWSAKLNR